MIDPTRTKLLEAIARLSERFPDWRLGQLVESIAGWVGTNTWDVEDQQLLTAIDQYLISRSENAEQKVG